MMVDIDKRRMTNYRFYTDRKWGMAGNYTLSLNSSELGYDMCENDYGLLQLALRTLGQNNVSGL